MVERRDQHSAGPGDHVGGDLLALTGTAEHHVGTVPRVAGTLTLGVSSGITMWPDTDSAAA